jgi:hypothetical protein
MALIRHFGHLQELWLQQEDRSRTWRGGSGAESATSGKGS